MVGIKPSLINYDKYSTKLQIYCLYFSIISSHLISIVSIINFFKGCDWVVSFHVLVNVLF